MAKCKICGNDFYSKECPHCKKIEWQKSLNENSTIDSTKYNNQAKKKNNTICPDCGKEYLTKVCIPCRNKREKGGNNFNIKNNPLLIVIAIAVSIMAFIMIVKQYEEYRAMQQVKQMFYGTTDNDKIEKINNDMMKNTNEILKTVNKENKSIMEMNNQMIKETNKVIQQLNKGFATNNSQRGN